MPSLNVLLDSNIWIDYLWYHFFSEQKGRKKKTVKLVELFDFQDKFVALLTPFLITEISSHFADWFLLQKVIKSGYSYREFLRERRNYNLSIKEKEKINEMVESISKKDFVNTITIEEIKKEELELLLTLLNEQISFFDALHTLTTISENCKFFVTKDNELRKRIQRAMRENLIPKKFKLISPQKFLNLL